jgi:hypothetical protein
MFYFRDLFFLDLKPLLDDASPRQAFVCIPIQRKGGKNLNSKGETNTAAFLVLSCLVLSCLGLAWRHGTGQALRPSSPHGDRYPGRLRGKHVKTVLSKPFFDRFIRPFFGAFLAEHLAGPNVCPEPVLANRRCSVVHPEPKLTRKRILR